MLYSELLDLLCGYIVLLDPPETLLIDGEYFEIDEVLLHVRKTLTSRREDSCRLVKYNSIPDSDRAIGRIERYVVAIFVLHTLSV